jgi:hypothetical protein
MTPAQRTIAYGDAEAPVLVRPWKRRKEMTPYYRIEVMKPGQCWSDMADSSVRYREHYVQLDGRPFPVGILIARELRDDGAIIAVCTDLTMGRLRFVDPDLICVEPKPPLTELLAEVRAVNGGSLTRLPDAIAIFADGRVALREAKVAKKDRLNPTQHAFARAARRALGKRLDLAVVEWGYEVAEDA